MKNLFRKLYLLFTRGKELEVVLEKLHEERMQAERERTRYRLDLCEKHQPRSPGTIYSEHNCDVCKLLKNLG